MTDLLEVDSVEVLVLVDNATDNLSSSPDFVESEVTRLERRGGQVAAGDGLCCAAHGLSCLVTVRREGTARSVLFDAGPDGEVFARNTQRLGAELHRVEAVVLSHGHWDHGGGMLRAIDLVRTAGGPHELPFVAHPDMSRQCAALRDDGTFQRKAEVPSPSALRLHGATPVLTVEPHLLVDGQVFVSGEIPRVTSFETGLPGQHRRASDEDDWEPDELVLDERFLAVHVRGRGMVVLTACSHAGVVNVLTHATELFPGVGIHAVVGGFHLSGANERIIPQTIEHLETFAPAVLAPGHCTGWRATAALLDVFGDGRLVPTSVGKRFTF